MEQKENNQEVSARKAVKHLSNPAVLVSILAVSTAVLYSGTLFFQFVWDDKPQIVDSPLIRSFQKLHRVFFSDLWYHTGRFQLYYRPLFVIWSMVNYAVFGLRPWGWHLGAILLHVVATAAVFWLARRLGLQYWTAAGTALIFAVHPIHIECVAWISAASDSMATIFVAFAFGAFLNGRERGAKHRVVWQYVSLLSIACGLLTKEITVGFCGLIAAYAWLFPKEQEAHPGERLRGAIRAALPYAMVTIAYLVLRKYALTRLTTAFDPYHSLGNVIFTLPYVLAFYLEKLLLPVRLTGLYYTPYLTVNQIGLFLVSLIMLVATGTLLVLWARRKKDPLVIFSGLWLIIGLAPTLYLRGFGNGDFVRDRYIYLGSIGFAILVGKAIALLPPMGRWSAPVVQGTAAMALCLTYVCMSIPQQAYWYSDLLIYSRAHDLYPENPYTSIGLAAEYERVGLYDRAIPLVEEARRNGPTYRYALYALADAYIAAGRKDEGRSALLYAQSVAPEYLENETGASSAAGMWGRLGDSERALRLCSWVLGKDPELFSALYNCGNIQLLAGNYAAAEELLKRAVHAASEMAAPRHFLGRTLFLDGKNSEAQPYLRQAVAMDPQVYDYHLWLGRSLEASGDLGGARTQYLEALQLNEMSADAKLHLSHLEAR